MTTFFFRTLGRHTLAFFVYDGWVYIRVNRIAEILGCGPGVFFTVSKQIITRDRQQLVEVMDVVTLLELVLHSSCYKDNKESLCYHCFYLYDCLRSPSSITPSFRRK